MYTHMYMCIHIYINILQRRYMPSGAKLMEVLLDASLPTDAAEEILRLVKHQVAPNPTPIRNKPYTLNPEP